LGLQRAPFLPHVDNTFYYAFPPFAQRLQMLKSLIQGRDFLVLVIGDQGSGKTTLLNQFLASTDSKWRGCKIRAYSKTKSNNAPLLENLDKHPAFILSDEKPPIVILDDAHKLTGIELQFFLQEALAPGSMNKLKRLVLFCEPSIQAIMAALTTPIAEETVVNKVYMPQIREEEIADYLHHRLNVAGLTRKNPFRASDIKAIYNASGGLPGGINEEAHKFLSQKYPQSSPSHIALRIIDLFKNRPFHLTIGGLILVSLVISILFQNRISSYFTPKELPESVAKIQTPSTTPIFSVSTKGDDKSSQELPKIEENINKPKQVSLEEKVETSEEEKVKKSVKVSEKAEKIVSGIYKESWILAQPSSYHTIQILGVRNEKSILNFVKQYKLWNKVSYFQTVYKDKKWFPLFYGVYSTKKEALSAVKELPEEIRKLSPWVRKMSSIHKEIKKNMTQ